MIDAVMRLLGSPTEVPCRRSYAKNRCGAHLLFSEVPIPRVVFLFWTFPRRQEWNLLVGAFGAHVLSSWAAMLEAHSFFLAVSFCLSWLGLVCSLDVVTALFSDFFFDFARGKNGSTAYFLLIVSFRLSTKIVYCLVSLFFLYIIVFMFD